MEEEKCCGTCLYFKRYHIHNNWGDCLFPNLSEIPYSINISHYNIEETDGKECPCWE